MDNRGKNVIIEWLEGLSAKARQNLKRTLEQLATKQKIGWERPSASPLGNHIYVIRFNDENRTQWRVYGEHDDERSCFVLTNFGTERGGKYSPPADECIQLARKRMADVRGDWDGRTCLCLSRGVGNAKCARDGSGNLSSAGLVRR